MDFKGQRLCELLVVWTVLAFAGASFVVGYAVQDVRVTAAIYGGGLLVAAIMGLPDWPCYNKHPVAWLPPLHPGGGGCQGQSELMMLRYWWSATTGHSSRIAGRTVVV